MGCMDHGTLAQNAAFVSPMRKKLIVYRSFWLI
eukprot:COSAG01_NODE_23760_length_802_cov_2.870555_1_plen_32_part_01